MSDDGNSTAEIVFKVSGFMFLVGAAYILAYVVSGGLLEGFVGTISSNASLTAIAFWVMVISYFVKEKNKKSTDKADKI